MNVAVDKVDAYELSLSMTRPCLTTLEVLDKIIKYVSDKTPRRCPSAALARTCEAWYDPVCNFFWQDVPAMQPLIKRYTAHQTATLLPGNASSKVDESPAYSVKSGKVDIPLNRKVYNLNMYGRTRCTSCPTRQKGANQLDSKRYRSFEDSIHDPV